MHASVRRLTVLSMILSLFAACSVPAVALQDGVQIEADGIIHSSRNVAYGNRTDSDLRVISIRPEGDSVSEGDFLIQFDAADLEQQLAEARLAAAEAEAPDHARTDQRRITYQRSRGGDQDQPDPRPGGRGTT